MNPRNVFNDIPPEIPAEITENILSSKSLKIERIISKGHHNPPDFWYDQDENEWVLLLSGSAVLKFEDGSTITMQSGDYLNIPSHKKHRVNWTDPEVETVWLAVFYST